jgi:hypothetical protein
MGKVVEFQAHLKPVSRIGFGPGATTATTKLTIRLAQLTKSAHDQDPTGELKPDSQWAWCVVQETTGQPDRFLVGGQSESMTAAAAEAQIALTNYETRLARKVEGN